MITEDLKKEVELCKSLFISEIEKIKTNSDKLKDHIKPDVLIPIVYLKIFSAWLTEKNFENLEDAWRLMNDIKGIIEKISYVNSNFQRIEDFIKGQNTK